MNEGAVALEAILEALPEPVVVTNAHGVILLANHKVLATFGYERAVVLGRPLGWLLREAGPGDQPVGRRADGSEFVVQILARSARTPAGSFDVVCIRDTTRLPGPGRASSQVERLAGVGRLAQDVARDARGALGTLSCRIDQMRLAADETGLPELVRQQLAALYREVRSLTATLDRLTP